MQKNVASQKIGAQMISASDGSEFTGAVTVYVTGDAGTQAAGSVGAGACTHEGHGYHTYAPAQAETNYDLIAFTFVGSGAVTATVQVFTRHDANVTHYGGTAGTFSGGRPEVNTSHAAGTAWGSGAITAASIAADAITAAKIANGAIDAATFAADVDAEILSYIVDDATRIDASALNTLSGHDPGETIMGATDLGTGAGLTSLATAAELAKVPKSDSNVTWNATAAAQIQSEVDDALVAQNLDHLIKIAVDTSFATTVHADSVIGQIADNGAGFDRTTDSLEAIRDRGDAAWITATGFSTHSAADVWAVGTRVLTAGTNIQLPSNGLANVTAWTVAITGNITGNLSGSIGSLGATAKADVNAEVDTALTDIHLDHLLAATYDPASKPGAADALLNELVESDAGVSRFTQNALEQGPGGGSIPTAAEIRAEIDNNSTQLAAIKAKTDLIVSAASMASTIFAAGDIDGYSLEESQKLILAAAAGEISGAATTTVSIRAADDSKVRISATVDEDGNRTALTLDETG